jgi:hypothetical protein
MQYHYVYLFLLLTAQINAVSPFSPFALTCAPFSSNISTISLRPLSTAAINAVFRFCLDHVLLPADVDKGIFCFVLFPF